MAFPLQPTGSHTICAGFTFTSLPVTVAALLLVLGGVFLLEKAERQERDTARKHHIEDIEQSLYFARSLHGAYPPYEKPTWCGFLNDPQNRSVRDQVEQALRAQHEKYANPDKPFPVDPLGGHSSNKIYDYFYWKHSPSSFELYAMLEQTPTGERNTADCFGTPLTTFDYGIASVQREPHSPGAIMYSPL